VAGFTLILQVGKCPGRPKC